MTIAMCPGSFDPPTSGHIDLIDRARAMFDKVIVAVIDNPSKRPMFTPTERAELFREIYGDTIDVTIFQGLLVEHARDMEVDVLVKGIRNGIDFEYEFQMAHMNRRLSGVETLFLPTSPSVSYISSSLVKEVARLGGPVSSLVPDVVENALKERLP
ncbi:MAG: pantetheine-phosphate adenylyltransferase [Acidimicrobiales bacterium]|nr:pantetheine-phosphate adenylyltransferase [Acidimicrobiales bacterium]HLV90478.1 pantetheine-phosphate adenylyltransferase [Acidimicrobiia bacterium]